MTPDDPLAAVRAALDEKERLARAATCEQWAVRLDTFNEAEVVTAEAHSRYAGDKNPEPYYVVSHGDFHTAVSAEDAEHIAANDPAAVLRRAVADRRVFARHKPVDARVEFSTFVCRRICAYCSDAAERADNIFAQHEWLLDDATQPIEWPCPDFHDLADGLGIDLEETTQ